MVITRIVLPRRTFIRGMGAALALPFLDAMAPALSAVPKPAPRFAAIYCGNGATMNGCGSALSVRLRRMSR